MERWGSTAPPADELLTRPEYLTKAQAGEIVQLHPKTIERAILDETVAETDRVLASLPPARLQEVTERAGEPFTVINLLLRTSHHWAAHVGQMVYAAKALRDGVFDELWRKTMVSPAR